MSAKILADSITAQGHRLTTMEVQTHRFVLAEFNTHRVFSRNSASSRAIPVAKQLDRVRNSMAEPVEWPAEQSGMQGGEILDPAVLEEARLDWKKAGIQAVRFAETLAERRVHKSVVNRLLEPFLMHTIVVTSTEYQNFFDQRCSPLAQPEIRVTAEAMKYAYENSTPTLLRDREWHLPYIKDVDRREALTMVPFGNTTYSEALALLCKVSAARCARVSYLTHDGVRDLTDDVRLYEDLITASPPHWSPLEHVATPWDMNVQNNANLFFYDNNSVRHHFEGKRPAVGNLVGWRSLRTAMQGVPVT